jgi:D-aspartate ligase
MKGQPRAIPVFVLNPYYTGIGIARNLHRRGIKVYGLSSTRSAPGTWSRFFTAIYDVPDGRDEPEALYRRLVEISKHHAEAPVIFPTRDFDVLFLHRYRERLSSFYRVPQSPGDSVLRLLDKFETATVAKRHEIGVPTTVYCSSRQEVDQQGASLSFPVVVKPRFAYQWRQKGAWEKVQSRKAVLIETMDQLLDEYQLLSGVTKEVLIQEYISGGDSDGAVCCCYIDEAGDLIGYFTLQKLRQSPPFVGTSCVVEATDIPEIVAPARRLLRAVGYIGLAEVEFKYDKDRGTFALIEVNPRHWDQHELGTAVGVNLSWIAYQVATGGCAPRQTPTYERSARRKWIAENELVWSMIQQVHRQLVSDEVSGKKWAGRKMMGIIGIVHRSLGELFTLLCGVKVFAVLHWSDPLPGIVMCIRLMRDIIYLRVSHQKNLMAKKVVTRGAVV